MFKPKGRPYVLSGHYEDIHETRTFPRQQSRDLRENYEWEESEWLSYGNSSTSLGYKITSIITSLFIIGCILWGAGQIWSTYNVDEQNSVSINHTIR